MITTWHWISGCWIVCMVYWLVSSLFVKRTAERQPWKVRSGHLLFLCVAFFVLFAAPSRFLAVQVIPHTPAVKLAAAVIATVGLLGALWSRITLGRNWSAQVTFKEDHELIERGPYRWVRHPIYTSVLLMFLGTVMHLGRVGGLVGLAICIASFWYKLRQEEAVMERHFPTAYPDYKRRVKALVPFVV